MKSIYKIILLAIFSVFMNQRILATHMMGSDISYQCISPGKYKLIFKVYRDCRGISLNNPTISAFCDGVSKIDIPNTRTAINDVSERCKGYQGPCNPSNSPSSEGIEEHVFEAEIDLNKAPYDAFKKAGCCEIYFSVEQCCRNNAITTISKTNLYTEAMLNICNVEKTTNKCNSSPSLTIPPVARICCNQCFTYNNGVTENIDGDSLAFSLVAALNGHNSNETYVSPFTPKLPMTPYCPPDPTIINCKPLPNAKPCRGFYFDQATGDIIFTPTDCEQVGVIVIQIDEYRRDSATKQMILVGRTRRDMQLVVRQCADNNPPRIISKVNSKTVCEGELVEIDIDTEDEPYLPNQKRLDTVELTWNYGIPGGSLKIKDTKAREKKATFTWQTKIGDARPSPYRFVAIAKDDNCDNPAQAVKGYTVLVKPKAKSFRQYDVLTCGRLKYQCFPIDTSNNEKYIYEWTIRDSTNSGLIYAKSYNRLDSIKFKNGGKYIITHLINNPKYNCPRVYQDTVVIPPQLNLKLAFGKDTFMCVSDSLILKPIIANGLASFDYQWQSPRGFNVSKAANYMVKVKSNAMVFLKISDKSKCSTSDSIKINIQNLPTVNIGPDQRVCTYQSITLDAQNADSLRYFWLPNGDSTRTLKVNKAGRYIVKVIDKLGCYAKDTMLLMVNDSVIAIAGSDKEICINNIVKLIGSKRPLTLKANFTWKDLSIDKVVANDSIFSQKIIQKNARKYELKVEVSQNGLTCIGADTLSLMVNSLPTFRPLNYIPSMCYEEACINLTLRNPIVAMPGNKPVDYRCPKSSKYLNGTTNVWWCLKDYVLNAKLPKQGILDTVKCCFTDEKGCFNDTIMVLKVRPNPLVKVVDKLHCQKAGLVNLNNLVELPFNKAGGIQTFKCIEAPAGSNVDLGSIISTNQGITTLDVGNENEPEKTGNYLIEYCFKDGITNCATCDTSKITVVRLPEIEFESIPTQCTNYANFNLDSFVQEKNSRKRFANGKWTCLAVNNMRDKSNYKQQNIIVNNIFRPSVGFGTYLLQFSDNSSGCEIYDSIEVVVYGLPVVKISKIDTLCSSEVELELKSNYPSSKNGIWSGFLVVNNNYLNASLSPNKKQYEGPYITHFRYTSPQTNCTNSDSIFTMVQNLPELNILNSKPYQLCEKDVFHLKATKKWVSNVIWQANGDGLFTDSNSLLTDYKHGKNDTAKGEVKVNLLTIKEGVCPIVKQSIQLIIHVYPQFTFSGDPLEQCEKAIVNFNSIVNKPLNKNLDYEWNFNGGKGINSLDNPQNVIFDTAARKGYSISLKVSNKWGSSSLEQCEIIIEKLSYVKVWPVPIADFTSDPSFFTTVAFPRFQFENKSKVKFGKLDYLWNFDKNNTDDTSSLIRPVHLYKADTADYEVSLTAMFHYKITNSLNLADSIGTCQDTKWQFRHVGPDVTVFVPTAFSPEGTGPDVNNVFSAVVNGEKSFEIEIFNRWGEKLWQSKDKHLSWNGKFKNVPCQQDVYMWKVKVTSFNGEMYNYEGTVTLLR